MSYPGLMHAMLKYANPVLSAFYGIMIPLDVFYLADVDGINMLALGLFWMWVSIANVVVNYLVYRYVDKIRGLVAKEEIIYFRVFRRYHCSFA